MVAKNQTSCPVGHAGMSSRTRGASCSFAYGVVVMLPSILGAGTCLAAAEQSDQQTRSLLEEVVVTATRREESLQKVPMAVTAITGESMERLSADDFVDFARTVPGVSFTSMGPGRNRVAIRGINVTGGENAIGYYIDETPIPKTLHGAILNTTLDPRMFDMQRVEILRGPQGTLYGQSSMGGTVRLIPNRPDVNSLFGSAGGAVEIVDHGSELFAADLMLNVPVVEGRMGIRNVVYGRSGGGYIDRQYLGFSGQPNPGAPGRLRNTRSDANSESTLGMRLISDFRVSDQLLVSALLMHENMTLDGYQDITAGPGNPGDELVQQFSFDTPEEIKQEWTLANITINADVGNVNFVSSSSYFTRVFVATEEGASVTELFLGTAFDGDENIGEHGSEDKYDVTQEFRLSSINPIFGRINWLVGAFYEKKYAQRWFDWQPPGVSDELGTANDELYVSTGHLNLRSIAGFGELRFSILDNLIATGGIRHYDVKQSDYDAAQGLFVGPSPAIIVTSARDKGEQLRFNLAYQATGQLNYYAQVAQGFRPGFGAANVFPPECDAELIALGIDPDNVPQQVAPDGVWNYELGAKTSWLEGRVRVNAAAYLIEWSDIQQRTRLETCGFNFQSNAGEATSKGFELEASISPSDNWELTGTVNYVDAQFNVDNVALSIEKGERIQEVPEWSAAASAQYSFPAFNSYNGYVRADVQYTGDSYADFLQNEGDPSSRLDDLTLVNVRLGMESADWQVGIYARNLFDESARIARARAAIIDIPGRPRYVINRPREFGISLNRRF